MAIAGGILLLALALFISPLLALVIGWLVGAIIELVTGNYTTDGLNVLLGTDRFVHGDFARITAIIAVLGSFIGNNNKSTKAGDN